MNNLKIYKIAIIGNACGGKSTLARRLSQVYQIQVTHIDSIQYLSGLKIRPRHETQKILSEITKADKWIIDGFGPLDMLEPRLEQADIIVLVDMPLWLHLWWFLKRQILSVFRPRLELPAGCSELNLNHTIKILKTIFKIHKQMRPELLRILHRPQYSKKVVSIKNQAQLEFAGSHGLLPADDFA